MAEEIMTAEEAATLLGVSRTTMHRMLKSGQLKGLKAGGQWRFKRVDVMTYLERGPKPLSPSTVEGIESELDFFSKLIGRENGDAIQPSEGATAEDNKIAALVNSILLSGLQSGASNIHWEAGPVGMRFRQRVDGVLEEVKILPSKLGEAVVARLKTMSGMDARQTQIPQDGRIRMKQEEHVFDLRLCTMPAVYGEALTARILLHSEMRGLEELNLPPCQLKELRNWLTQPRGLILVCGPAGSGKTTLLYGLIGEVTEPTTKVMSIEDPVEVNLPGVTQSHVNRRAGITFTPAVRAMLRHDPDVIMIGALPDAETVSTAFQAAESGILALSQLPVLNVGQAVSRLLDLDVDPFIVASSLVGVVSQRLLRCVCPDCAETIDLTSEMEETLRNAAQEGGYAIPQRVEWKQGSGCDKCRQSGYRGRQVVCQIVPWNELMRELTQQRASEGEFETVARESGVKSLKAEGVRLAIEGKTSPEEVVRVLLSTVR